MPSKEVNRPYEPRYWLVGSYWEGSEQIDRFIKEGIWVNGHTDKFVDRVNNVRPGDIIIIKSSFVRDKTNYLRIKAVGIVAVNRQDGHNLIVNWRFWGFQFDFARLGHYADTIQELNLNDYNILDDVSGSLKDQKPNNPPPEPRHTLSVDRQEFYLILQGFRNYGLIGYVNESQKQNSHVLYRMFEPQTVELTYENVPDILMYHPLGYIDDQPGPEKMQLQRFSDGYLPTYFCCTKPRADKLTDEGYEPFPFENVEGPFISIKKQEGQVPLYLYSTENISDWFQVLKKTDAHLLEDNPSSIDELGRRAVIELVFNKTTSLWPKLKPTDSYTILLNGEWGSGKSSMLQYFKEFLEKDHWTVIDYNAWAHQHLEDQWWVLVNKVSKHISGLPDRGDMASHNWWIFKLQNHNTLVVVLLAAVFLASGYGLADFFLLDGEDITLYGSLIGLLGTIWVTFTGIVQNIFKRKVNSATLATNYSSDPYKPIKDRFEEVTKDRKVAIFIDDLDRCEVSPTVELLEGIQNLFKQTKVLYVIAADGNWVSNCFNNKYKDFENLGHEGHSIGNQFLQKSFQMVVDVPKIGPDQHEVLWKKYLGIYKEENLDQSEEEEFEEQLEKAETTAEVRSALSKTATLDQRIDAASKLEDLVDDHLLLDYLEWIPTNPRQMKRLINHFIIKYQSLIIANTIDKVSEKALIHYIIFAASYPDYDAQLRSGARTLDYLRSLKDETLSKLLEVELTDDHIRNIL